MRLVGMMTGMTPGIVELVEGSGDAVAAGLADRDGKGAVEVGGTALTVGDVETGGDALEIPPDPVAVTPEVVPIAVSVGEVTAVATPEAFPVADPDAFDVSDSVCDNAALFTPEVVPVIDPTAVVARDRTPLVASDVGSVVSKVIDPVAESGMRFVATLAILVTGTTGRKDVSGAIDPVTVMPWVAGVRATVVPGVASAEFIAERATLKEPDSAVKTGVGAANDTTDSAL